MRTIFKSALFALILAAYAGTSFAADPVLGTWSLNLAKSKFSPGPAPKSQTRIYAESPRGINLTLKTTDSDGKQSSITLLTPEYDGKPHPFSGNPDFDMVSNESVDALTVRSTQTKGGVTVVTTVRTVSRDGKTLTFVEKGTHADGVKFSNVSVYDRQ